MGEDPDGPHKYWVRPDILDLIRRGAESGRITEERKKLLAGLFKHIASRIEKDIGKPRSVAIAIKEEALPERVRHVSQLMYYRFCEVMEYTPDKSMWDEELDRIASAGEGTAIEQLEMLLGVRLVGKEGLNSEEFVALKEEILSRTQDAFFPLGRKQIDARPQDREALERGWVQFKTDMLVAFDTLVFSK